jgi:hypothetical protein
MNIFFSIKNALILTELVASLLLVVAVVDIGGGKWGGPNLTERRISSNAYINALWGTNILVAVKIIQFITENIQISTYANIGISGIIYGIIIFIIPHILSVQRCRILENEIEPCKQFEKLLETADDNISNQNERIKNLEIALEKCNQQPQERIN